MLVKGATDDIWSGSNTNTNCAIIHHLHLYVKLMELWIIFRCLTVVGRVACGGLPFQALVVLYRMLRINIIENQMINVCDTFLLLIHFHMVFLSTEVIFKQQIRQFTMGLFIANLHINLV